VAEWLRLWLSKPKYESRWRAMAHWSEGRKCSHAPVPHVVRVCTSEHLLVRKSVLLKSLNLVISLHFVLHQSNYLSCTEWQLIIWGSVVEALDMMTGLSFWWQLMCVWVHVNISKDIWPKSLHCFKKGSMLEVIMFKPSDYGVHDFKRHL